MKKRAIGCLLCAVLLLLNITAAMAISEKSDWASENIQKANQGGILSQDEYLWDFTQPIRRGELATLILRAYQKVTGNKLPKGESPFNDTNGNGAYAISQLGIMNGTGDGKFSPYEYTTREAVAKIMLSYQSVVTEKGLSLPSVYENPFGDFATVSDWAKPYVEKAYQERLLNGYDDGNFYALETVSREQAIALILRCAELPVMEAPAILTPGDDRMVSSQEKFSVSFSEVGNYKLYAYQAGGYGRSISLGSCNNSNAITVNSGNLNGNSLYYLYAERNGVFSAPVKVYTDTYQLFLESESFAEPGNVTVRWNRLPEADVYTLKITECRNSRHPGDIDPKEPVVYELRWESEYTFYANPNRLYTVELSTGEYSAVTEIYVQAMPNPGAEEIYQHYPTSREEADALVTTVTVPVWKMRSNGSKYSSTASIQVHYAIAERVKLVFEEIYNGSEQFPIKDVGGYSWRGGTTEHNGGTAIDINSNENYCIYDNGTTIGKYWKPYEDPYSITPYGDVIRAFEKYGFTWGGDAWSNPRDYMHFSYLGT